MFSTHDHETDGGNCATNWKGGWWYWGCHDACLNGQYRQGSQSGGGTGIVWYHWKNNFYSLRKSEMKIKST